MSVRSIVAMLALMACLGVIGCGDHGDSTETTTPPASPEMLDAIPSFGYLSGADSQRAGRCLPGKQQFCNRRRCGSRRRRRHRRRHGCGSQRRRRRNGRPQGKLLKLRPHPCLLAESSRCPLTLDIMERIQPIPLKRPQRRKCSGSFRSRFRKMKRSCRNSN